MNSILHLLALFSLNTKLATSAPAREKQMAIDGVNGTFFFLSNVPCANIEAALPAAEKQIVDLGLPMDAQTQLIELLQILRDVVCIDLPTILERLRLRFIAIIIVLPIPASDS